MHEDISFGEWVRQRRRMLDLTQQELADQVGCARITLRRIESDSLKPSKELAQILLEKLAVPPTKGEVWLRFARGLSGFPERPVDSSVSKPLTNLPTSLSTFIGREKEQDEITNLLKKNRLVTLTGAGGIGKTRLSIQAASTLLNNFPNGSWLVELAPLSDPALMPQTIVNTLGLLEQAGRSYLNILTGFLHEKRALLILDNCEHLIQACAALAETLLQACPDLHILPTSREALSIAGETVYLVPSLTTPDPLHSTLDTLAQYEAAQLFLDRAQSVVRDFSLTQDNAHAIAQVCYHLDGIPLAIELAAARVKLLQVEEIAARLDDRFRLLTSGARTALPRHQTLQAMIDWSYDLLTEPERNLLMRLSVFAGGWSLESAELVCAGDGIRRHAILDVLTQLVNKSLIVVERKQEQETRYSMLETIRQYAREKLWQAGEGELMRQQHLAYFVDLAEQAEPNLRAFDMMLWLDRLELELDNIRAALEWALESDAEAILQLAGALWWFWHIRDHKSEGAEWLERALSIEEMERGDHPLIFSQAINRGKALYVAGFLRLRMWETDRATALSEESLRLFQELGPLGKRGMAYALWNLGAAAGLQPEPDIRRRKALMEESLALFQEVGDKFGIAQCLPSIGDTALSVDSDYERAKVLTEEGLALYKEIGDKDGMANTLGALGYLALRQNDYPQAVTWFEVSLVLFREVENKFGVVRTLFSLGQVPAAQGDYKQAAKRFEEGLAIGRQTGNSMNIAFGFYYLGKLAWLQGNYEQATQKFEATLTVSRETASKLGTILALHGLGSVAQSQGDYVTARSLHTEAIVICQEIHHFYGAGFHSEALATLAATQNKLDRAARLFGAAEEVLPAIRFEMFAAERDRHDQVLAAVRTALGEEAFDAVYEEGKKLTLDEVVAYALNEN